MKYANRFKKHIVIFLVMMMVICFTPFLGNAGEAFAADDSISNCDWITRAAFGLANGYAVKGSEIVVDMNQIQYMQDEGGSNVSSPLSSADPECVTVSVEYHGDNGTEIIGQGMMSEGDLVVKVPDVSGSGEYIRIEANDRTSQNIYYYSTAIRVVEAKVSSEIMNDLGSITFDLKDPGVQKKLTKGDLQALKNTILIAKKMNKVNVIRSNDKLINFDINKDLITDVEFGIEKNKEYYYNFTDQVSQKASKRSISIADGNSFDPSDIMTDKYQYYNKLIPYYSKIIFNIDKRDISEYKFYVNKTKLIYNGKYQRPKVTKVRVNNINLVQGTDFKVTGTRKSIGKGTITITGIGRYKGVLKRTFKVVPGKVKINTCKGSKQKLYVKWYRRSGGVRYHVKYRLKGASSWKNFYTANNYKTIKNLKKGKIYEVKVRAYKKVGGAYYGGEFSETLKIKITK